MLPLILVATIFALLCFWLWLVCPYKWRSSKFTAIVNKMPGPKPLPIIGNCIHYNIPFDEVLDLFKTDFEKYGPNFRIWQFGTPYVITCDPDSAESLLKSRTQLAKSDSYDFLHNLMGVSIGTSSGEVWHSQRKMLVPAFHADSLRDYLNVFNENCQIMVDNLTSLVDEDWVDIQKSIALCSLDNLCGTLMGIKLGAQLGKQEEFVAAIHRICQIIGRRMFSPWLFRPLSFKLSSLGREEVKVLDVIHSFAGKVIKEKRADALKSPSPEEDSSDKSKKRRPNLTETLLNYTDEKGAFLTDQYIIYEVSLFLFLGHDTTTVSISWALFVLGSHPEIQDRVAEELDSIFGDSNRHPELSDLHEMKYMDRMIKEALRLYPGVPAIARKLEEDMEVDGYTIPAGTNMTVMSYFMHRDPKYFPDPEKFDPDRFLPEQMEGRHPFCYVPFSAGPRSCIGQRFSTVQEKVILSFILRKFRVTSLDKKEDIKGNMEIVLRPTPCHRIKLTLRK